MLFLRTHSPLLHFLPYESFNLYQSIDLAIIFLNFPNPPVLPPEEITLAESLKYLLHCPRHPCFCPYRCIWIFFLLLLINTIRNYCLDTKQWSNSRKSHATHANLRADEGERIELYPRAYLYFGPHCQRCFDPRNCTNSLWHVWQSLLNPHWLLGVQVPLNWVLSRFFSVTVLGVVCVFLFFQIANYILSKKTKNI